MPPGFAPVEIDGEHSWDGGLVSNTPLQYVLDQPGKRRRVVFQVDLFATSGELPATLAEATEREKDIRFSSLTRLNTPMELDLQVNAQAAQRLIAKLPPALQDDPDLLALASENVRRIGVAFRHGVRNFSARRLKHTRWSIQALVHSPPAHLEMTAMRSFNVFSNPSLRSFKAAHGIAAVALVAATASAFAQTSQCVVNSGPTIAPVVELYTSEGCSSCPPADKWASSLKGSGAVVQAFHVGYWDYIGWVDRFAAPAYTNRQRDVAARNNLRSIYTPQAVLNGKDWPNWGSQPKALEPAKASIALKQLGADQFEASVVPLPALQNASTWSAYWTITEHGHNSKVHAGENAGEFLKHDFVVRQLVQAGEYKVSDAALQKLTFRSIASTPGHQRQVNLVVFDAKTGKTLQAVSLQCTV